jgi:hypothetical protein
MEWVERVDTRNASPAQELHPETINASEFAFFLAELAIAIGGQNPMSFMPDRLVKGQVTIVLHPRQEGVVLATVSVLVHTTACERAYPRDIVLPGDVPLVSVFTKSPLVEVQGVKVGNERVDH